MPGTIVGALLLAGALHFHVIRTDRGVTVVPKVGTSLSGSFVDIRGFTSQDWQQHQPLAAALLRARRSADAAGASRAGAPGRPAGLRRLRPRIDAALDRLLGSEG